MCNCEDQRNRFALSESLPAANSGKRMWTDIWFEYTGRSSLTVKGFITGKWYRFEAPGAMVQVDYRDAAKMLLVPLLKQKQR